MRQGAIDPSEFAELVAMATHEVIDSFISGEYNLAAYRNSAAEEYKELAEQSIQFYIQTSEKIGQISDQQAIVLSESTKDSLIDLRAITEKFSEIQNHLSDEVARANDVIRFLIEQVKSLEMKTSLDPLTKVFNRYALQEHLKVILEKEKLDFDIFALMIDVDNFKMINDRFGHIAGDKVLIFIAKILQKALREGDHVYRFGGEEFIILLNRTDLEGAKLVAERLLNLCRNNKLLFQNQQIAVTLSIGLTKILNNDTVDRIIERSDTALYRAKNNGKDQYEMEL
ncbi:MAG: GGDEF domain-containing protein [Sulfuricurvum sp.]|nr:GGDEF domain-containing protein [Sulfuricurvum sp.]